MTIASTSAAAAGRLSSQLSACLNEDSDWDLALSRLTRGAVAVTACLIRSFRYSSLGSPVPVHPAASNRRVSVAAAHYGFTPGRDGHRQPAGAAAGQVGSGRRILW
jgi:hypothetical protein